MTRAFTVQPEAADEANAAFNWYENQQAGLGNETFSVAYGQTVAALGYDLQTANNQVSSQTSVANMLSTQRGTVSGVNLDEEMTNLMGFQRAYEASAQLVTTVNQMMQTVLAMKT